MFTVGHELIEVKGFAKQLEARGRRLVAESFTSAEYAQLPPAADRQAPFLAGRLAAKRSFVKAWAATQRGGPPPIAAIDLREIEVLNDDHGRPGLRLHGLVAEAVEDLVLQSGLRVEAQVSISDDSLFASAVVILHR
jgi:holo-[acyl-carrier protein] synthase